METHVLENKVELAQLGVRFIVRTNNYHQCPKPFNNYFASSSGKITTENGKVLATLINNAGYEMVKVSVNGKQNTTTVHRLVALAWVKKPETNERLIVDHINDCKTDNRASNLRWISYHDNLVKHHRMATMSGEHSYCHGRAVVKVSQDGREKFYRSISAAARDNQMSVTSVQGSANHTLNLNRPYHFEFTDKQMEEK
ncbi:HNH endonuclease [Schleiferilactobacillus harbinensis]|uniref:HNH endonuclease n=1 Tax=Schleiferilactobacillus harbinensis TaxID=304207 RepID=UPI00116E41B8|nr:HNH endonuclease [Schleiferilactobacillus harbinensis]GEK06638.1 hypothetical protein LHA01_18770 [Schleiferilactobacillus harbinensis]